ncbi:MAG: hypothetical protein KUG82_01725 [Pseudomonadales bacterium]|nr:hypothetical protein [Pseudomonadales bacterium]
MISENMTNLICPIKVKKRCIHPCNILVICVLAVVFFCGISSFSKRAFASTEGSEDRAVALSKALHQKVVEVSAVLLLTRGGLDKGRYSIMAVTDQKLQPIPFQIDEYNGEGEPFFAKARVPILGELGKFDADDRLLFMLEDAGIKMPGDMVSDVSNSQKGELIAEIKVDDATGVRYVYLFVDNPMRSSIDYVRYDPETGLNESDYYSLFVNKKNLLDWTNLSYNDYTGPNPDSIIDTLKLRISGRILLNMASLTLTNRNLKAKLLGYVDGPIRSIVQLKTSIVIAKVPVMKIEVQLLHYRRQVHAISRTKTPKVIPYLFRDPKISLSIDANDMKGSQLYTALLPNQPAQVDGFLSRNESSLISNGIDKNHTWLLLRSPHNFQVLTSLDNKEKDQTPVSLLYQDDDKLKNKPERFVGQLPNFGYVIKNIPMESIYYMGIRVYFDDNSFAYDPVTYAEQIAAAPKVSVHVYSQ